MKKLATLMLITLSITTLITGCNEPDIDVQIPELMEHGPLPHGAKICIIGDTGMGNSGQWYVGKALAGEGCHHVRVLGDVIYPNGLEDSLDPQFQDKFYLPYKDLLEGGVPFYMIMGNHDFRGDPSAWLELAQEHETIIFPNYFYAETWGDLCITSLETDVPSNAVQEYWARNIPETLKEKGCRISIAMAHHPLVSVGKHGNAKGKLKEFIENLIIGKYDLYITGHDHQLSDEGSIEGTQLLISGGGGGKLRKLKYEVKPGNFGLKAYGYLVLEIIRDAEGNPTVHYVFKKVKKNEVTPVWEKSLTPQGIRL